MIGLPFGLLTGEPPRNAQCCSVFAGDTNSGQTFAGFRVIEDGQVQKRQGQSQPWVTQCNYVTAGLNPLVGNDFEIKVEKVSGFTPQLNAGLGVWFPINGTLTWAITENPGQFRNFQGTYQIREIAVPSNISGTCNITLDTEDGS